MPERFFRYIVPARVDAYVTMGWQVLGELECSPYDQRPVVIVEWAGLGSGDGEPIEPPRDRQ